MQQRIAGGTPDTVRLSVGAVEGGECSGTLIGRHTVLTAAHCVNKLTGDAQFCSSLDGFDQHCEFGPGTPHPGYDPGWSGEDQDDDVGVICLRNEFPTTPTFISTGINYQPAPGHTTTLVGMSGTDRNNPQQGAGLRRSGSVAISEVGPGQFSTDGVVQIVHGDSGGPAFRTDWVDGANVDCQIGVASTERTGTNVSTFARVDQKFEWIVATAHDPTVRGCHNACQPAGNRCTTNGDCCSGACVCTFGCGGSGVFTCQ